MAWGGRAGGVVSADDVYFVNNSLEGWTSNSSGAIATHIAETRAAALRAGASLPVVITRAPRGPSLDDGPRLDLSWPPRAPTGLSRRVLDKGARLRGWQSWDNLLYARKLEALLRRRAGLRSAAVLHNDPDVADWLARRLPHLKIVHVFHNVLPHGRASSVRVTHLAVSGWLARALRERRSVPSTVSTLPNGVDSHRYRPSQGVEEDRPLGVSFLGRTGIEKGLDILHEALLALPDEDLRGLRLLVIGSNTWGEVIRDPYQSLLADQQRRLAGRGMIVETTGHLGRHEVPDALRTSMIHVVPSRWQDPAPLVLMEAMASGLAVLAARSGGMPEYGGDACLWFDREDSHALSQLLLKTIRDPELRRDLARRARERGEALSWDRTWESLQPVLRPAGRQQLTGT